MARLRDDIIIHKDIDKKTGQIREMTDEVNGEPTHDAMVTYVEGGARINCDCQNSWLVTERRGEQLEDNIVATFQAHVSYYQRAATKPD